jgi:NADH-quinone oxidoreductase subunit G
MNEPRPPQDPDSPLAFSMEGSAAIPPSPLIPRFWSAGWNSVQSVDKYQAVPGGPLRGGDPGKRLIQPAGDMPPFVPESGPPREAGPERGILVVAARHVFGSEELSARSPGVASLIPEPYILFHPDDAAELGVAAGNLVELRFGSQTVSLAARVGPNMVKGAAAVPVGLPGLAALDLPGWGIVKAVWK